MASLDANCLLRWILGDVPTQRDAVEALFQSERRLVVEDAVLIETVFVLERSLRLDRPLVCQAIEELMARSAVELDRAAWSWVLATYLGHPKLSVVDVYRARRAADRRSLPLYTFDSKMIAQLDAAAAVPDPT
jgi:predicted nucleic-acid-binding protein